MMNVIKTAIITIVISIISGLLLEYFKNVAPRILCSIGKGVAMEINNKRVYAYNIIVRNLSKKTIHDLTLNIHSDKSYLKIADAKITKGLKFDSSTKDDSVEIDIPFLSKGDKFSVTVYVENKYGLSNKPIIVLRSPENFKEVNNSKENGILSLFNTDDSDKIDKIHKNNKPSRNKKVIISIVSIIVFMLAGGLLKLCFEGISTDAKQPSVKTDANEKFNNEMIPVENKPNKNIETKVPTRRKSRNTDKNKLKEEINENETIKKSKDESIKNSDIKVPTNKIDENKDTKASQKETIVNKDEETKKIDAKKSKTKEGTNEKVNEKQVKDGQNKNEIK